METLTVIQTSRLTLEREIINNTTAFLPNSFWLLTRGYLHLLSYMTQNILFNSIILKWPAVSHLEDS